LEVRYLAVLAVTSTSISMPGHAGGLRRARERLGTAFSGVGKVANVGHVGDDLVDVLDRRAVLRQQPLDLVPCVAALGADVAEVADHAALGAVFVLGADAAEIDDLAGVAHRHDLRKAPLRPFGVVVVLLLVGTVAVRRLRLCDDVQGQQRNQRRHRKLDHLHDFLLYRGRAAEPSHRTIRDFAALAERPEWT
jgi:hypothetical protein